MLLLTKLVQAEQEYIFKRLGQMGCTTIIAAAVPGFFLSALFLMLLWKPISSHFGIGEIDYVTSMLITITIWVVVAPLAAAAGKQRWWKN